MAFVIKVYIAIDSIDKNLHMDLTPVALIKLDLSHAVLVLPGSRAVLFRTDCSKKMSIPVLPK